ncbi:SusC/RagA family TonB-linked outer membrane protein [Membranihabitans maritimus]|uniref:SusC/RagA family TonB-linked outer membrane protein n=1 Tax=Membranihabitans maritimus TaxID=2904244 RepID=UPI001F363D49|nr:TonB-dependent receptor [Membranihabitans maritimus]
MILILVSSNAIWSFSQSTISIEGKVLDAESSPLIGATVLEKGTENGTTTDFDGQFSLSVASENAVLIVSYIGYTTKELSLSDIENGTIMLDQSSEMLDEVVVVGYGEQSRRTLTTAISRIGGDDLATGGVSMLSSSMQGKMSGVRVYHSEGGMPGADATISIRGGSSINRSNAPLVLIDGMQRPLSDINPGDIKSIDILKDASSTAIYGARASNGVVLVTTMRGREGMTNISFEATTGIASPWKYMDLLNGSDYLTLSREALSRSPSSANLWQRGRGLGIGNDENSPWSTRYLEDNENIPEGYSSIIDPVDPTKTIIFQDNDYQKLTLQNGMEQNYYISANGGSEKILYSAGLGYTNLEGISVGTNWDRLSARVNVDFKINSKLKLLTNFDHTSSTTNTWPSQHSMFNRTLFMTPTARIYMEDGSFAPGLNATFTNPLWYNDVHDIDDRTNRTQFGASLIWNVFEGLQIRTNADYYSRSSDVQRFEKANVYSAARTASFNYNKNNRKQLEVIATYNKSFAVNHNFNLMAGASYLAFDDLDARAVAFGASTDKIPTLNAGPEKSDAYTFAENEILAGLFSRLTYDYKQKYLVGVSIRRDVSSRFASDNRVGYFPGLSLGWILSEEQFFNISLVDNLKLRTSWGKTGNNNVGRYDAWGLYTVGANYEFSAGILPSVMPNYSLGWESTTQMDVGFDLAMFDYRLNFILDYYDKTTNDLIFNTPLPNTSGYNSILRNIGSVQYYGWDLELNFDVFRDRDFNWNTGVNISINKNKVLSLPENGIPNNRISGVYNPETNDGVGGIAEGEPLGQLIGHRADFIIDNWEQANDAHFDTQAKGYDPEDGSFTPGRKFPGDMEWVDKDGNNIIDDYDQFVLGNQIPIVVGGISNVFSYKNFELKIFTDYALGHSISDKVIRRADANALDGIMRPTPNIFGAWKEIGDVESGKATMPRYDYHDASQQRNIHRGNYNTSTTMYKGNFINIREVTLGYTIPKKIGDKMGLKNANFYLSGQNLHYFTKYPGFVPEFQGQDNHRDGNYPIARKIILGLKITL